MAGVRCAQAIRRQSQSPATFAAHGYGTLNPSCANPVNCQLPSDVTAAFINLRNLNRDVVTTLEI